MPIKHKARELTEQEVRNNFLAEIKGMVEYWDKLPQKTTTERLNGLAFSILVLLDGESANMPGFILAPLPHEDDKRYSIEETNENYYPQNHESEVNCDFSGSLHDDFYK